MLAAPGENPSWLQDQTMYRRKKRTLILDHRTVFGFYKRWIRQGYLTRRDARSTWRESILASRSTNISAKETNLDSRSSHRVWLLQEMDQTRLFDNARRSQHLARIHLGFEINQYIGEKNEHWFYIIAPCLASTRDGSGKAIWLSETLAGPGENPSWLRDQPIYRRKKRTLILDHRAVFGF